MKQIFTTGFIFTIFGISFAQNLPEGLRISNQMEYSFGTLEREQEDIKNRETFENWLNLNYNKGIFTSALRFDVFQPFDDPNNPETTPEHIDFDLAFKNIGLVTDHFEMTLGNYYVLFGRGLLLNCYEQRDIRYDNNLEGVKFRVKNSFLDLTALSGSPENDLEKRQDNLHAADIVLKVPENFLFNQKLSFGATLLSNQFQPEANAQFQRLVASSGRTEFKSDYFDFYGEFGHKWNTRQGKTPSNDPTKNSAYDKGNALYLSGVFSLEIGSLLAEWKNYDNFRISQQNTATEFYNTPPSLIRQHHYTLLNRHPLRLDANDEKGYQFEINSTPLEKMTLILNTSKTKTQNESSEFYKRNGSVNGKTVWEEIYGQVNYDFNDEFQAGFGLGKSKELVSSNAETITPVFECDYTIGESSELHFELQHQQIKSLTDFSKSNDELLTLEYTTHGITFSLLSEILRKKELTNNNISSKNKTNFWNFGQVAFTILENHDLTLGFGSRQGGFVCIGGVCREEPPFKGFEAKLISRF
ncbi:hypothetical protein IT568_13590 [bacterium]|nr:hypothetical protein [bacterium]